MPAQTRVGKILGPYRKRTLGRKPIQPYSRPNNSFAALKNAVGVENKYFDIEVAANIPTNVGFTSLTTALRNPEVPLGDEVYQRNGRQILLKRVTFRGNVFTTPATAQTSAAPCSSGRLILWRNDQFNISAGGSYPIGKADGTPYANAANAIGGFQSPNANGFGKIVDDLQFTLTPSSSVNNTTATTVSTTAQEVPVVLSYKPKTPMKLLYQAAALSASPDKWFTIFGNIDAQTFLPSLNGVMRFYYTDA
jgi:hypothetical protein